MSEEAARAAGDIDYWRRRAEQAEALALTLQAQRDQAEADAAALVSAIEHIEALGLDTWHIPRHVADVLRAEHPGASLLADLAELRKANAEVALNVALAQSAAEHDLVKALLIQMRGYIISHGLLIGECVAWNQLKRKFCVGQSSSEDDTYWLMCYEARKASGE